MSSLELLAWALLILVLLRALASLEQIYSLLRPDAPPPPPLSGVPRVLLRKAALTLKGAVYLVLSRDKVSSSALRRTIDPAELEPSRVTREVRLIFVRHGESVWNLVFNRGFGLSFPWRLLSTLLHELLLVPVDDSAFLDSPLSPLGLQQCGQLATFLAQPCVVGGVAERDHRALTTPGGALLVSSQLRRAVGTLGLALRSRLAASDEPVLLHSSLQEISRNFDTQSLACTGGAPPLDTPLRMDGSTNGGNKSLSFTGMRRLQDFAQWAAARHEPVVVVGGHSLWFRSFFQLYLPRDSDHPGKTRKIVNCGAVGLTLQVGRTAVGEVVHRIDPESINVVYGGFSAK
mmetsp:Transcript_24504/g.78766  ORF Transcript_24504/g.78766 Transcript_24504/m.78766 type:complete len:346 (-) Transcript_24504:326-1363(-)